MFTILTMRGILTLLTVFCWTLFQNSDLTSGLLATLPKSRNVYSNMILFDDHLGDVGGIFNMIEFIDEDQGSSRVDISDVSQLDLKQATRFSFFRLLQEKGRSNSELVRFEHESFRCSEVNTKDWLLKDFTQMLDKLYAVDEEVLNTSEIRANPILFGPNAMLQIVYDNAEKFIYDSNGFDEILLTNTYYFSMLPFDFGLEDQAKLIVITQFNHINIDAHNDEDNMQALNSKLKIKSTKLSELYMLGHISGIALVTDIKRRVVSDYLNRPSAQLVDFARLRPSRLAMYLAFSLIEQRSHAQHLGVSEPSPLLLPAGVGCGQSASRHQPLFVMARQFSGHFSAMDHPNDYFVAYDEASNHLRYDALGRHELIFALNDQVATLIEMGRGDGGEIEPQLHSESASTSNSNSVHENLRHCAQTDLMSEDQQALRANSLVDIFGLGGSRIGLMYLGYDHLLDCHLYEREISLAQIPLLVRLHLRLVPSATAKFTLVFHFIDELDSLTGNSPFSRKLHAYESMWLRRIDLISATKISKYTLTNSQLEFSRSSWSLAIAPEMGRERELLHPSRMFDTLDCWPARAQTQLDFVLKRTKTIGGAHDQAGEGTRNRIKFFETLEESLMQFLMQQTGFPRSEVCDFEVILPQGEDQPINCDGALNAPATESNDTDSRQLPETMLIRSKLVRPLEFTFKHSLIGWIKTIVQALKFTRHTEVLEHKYMMNIQECLLALAARLRGPDQFHMLFCPRTGCAHLVGGQILKKSTNSTSDDGLDESNEPPVDKLEYIPFDPSKSTDAQAQGAPSQDTYPEMCEIHLVKKHLSTEGLITERFRPEVVREKLHMSKMVLEAYEVTTENEVASRLHQAIVSQVSLTAGLDVNSRDDQLNDGICFTLATEFRLADTTLPIRLIELNFDLHHSRAHCHKACLLQEFCQSYSYSKRRRVCHLSSASRRLLVDPGLSLKTDKGRDPSDCTIHSLNHLSLYKRMPFVIYETVKGLAKEKSQWRRLIECSLDDCAYLCRLNELSRSPGCQRFSYIRMRGLCIVEGDVLVTGELANSSLDVSKLDAEDSKDDLEPGERYQRNFLQDYAVQLNNLIVMEQPKKGLGDGVDSGPSAITMMADLNEFECSRECSIIDRECVAFDWCPSNKLTSYKLVCRLYRVRSPLTVPRLSPVGPDDSSLRLPESSPFEAQLTKLESEFYSAETRSSEYKIRFETKPTCKHFYLDGDNLFLKRALSVAMRNYRTDGDEKLEEDVAENNYAPAQQPGQHSQSDSFGRVLSQTLLGFLIGFVLFLLQPALVQLVQRGDLIERFQNLPKLRGRSMSQVEITEMIDLEEEEQQRHEDNPQRR